MKRFVLSLMLLAGTVGLLPAEPPVILGPKTVLPYKVVRLTVDAATVDTKAGLVWRIAPSKDVDKITGLRDAKTQFQFVAPPGTYTVTLLAGKLGAEGALELEETSFDVNIVGAKPQPDPGPKPPPVDPVVPTTPTKLVIVGVDETDDAVAKRGQVFLDPALNARMKEKGHKFRIVDQNVVGPDNVTPPADVKRFLDLAKGKALPQMFLVDEKGKVRNADTAWPDDVSKILQAIINAGG